MRYELLGRGGLGVRAPELALGLFKPSLPLEWLGQDYVQQLIFGALRGSLERRT